MDAEPSGRGAPRICPDEADLGWARVLPPYLREAVDETVIDDSVLIEQQRPRQTEFVHPPACDGCRERPYCRGVRTAYAALHGVGELRAINA